VIRLDIQDPCAYTYDLANFSKLALKIAKECSGVRIRQASRLLTRVYDDALRPLGINESQLSVLTAIAIFGERGATMGALASALLMDRTTLTRNVQPLEKAGLLLVARSAEDARARVVILTRAGERAIESAAPLWELAQKQVRRALGAPLFEAFRSRLDDVIARAEELDAKEPGR
jgi:DNA-binding MarR family transcriptional regulator